MFLEQMEGQELAGRFLLRRLVGKGGYGAVFEAEQLSVGRRCAVKVLLPDQCENEAITRRFAIEARAISQLVHTNSVVLYDFGQSADHNKLLYLAMEFLEGQDLNQLIETTGQISLETTVHIARQIGGSLHEAHMQGLVHRDVKPHNVMLIERHKDPYFVKVIDFGIAKALQSSRLTMQELTQAGTMIGTPHYMAPEQVLDGEIDGRTDQYALATTIYKMLAGRTPFQGITAIEVASKQLSENPLPVSTYRKDLQNRGTLDNVLLRALSKKPGDRYADVMDFVDAFAAAAEMQHDQAYYSEESTMVDAPAPQSAEVAGTQEVVKLQETVRFQEEEVLPATRRLEPVTAQTSMTIVGDDTPGSTLFIAQGFNSAELEASAEQRALPSQNREEQTTEPPIAVPKLIERRDRRNLLAEVTALMIQHKWLVGVTLMLSCVFMVLFGIVFGQAVLSRAKAKSGDAAAIAVDQITENRQPDLPGSPIVSVSNHGGGLVVDGAKEAKIDTQSTQVAGKEFAQSVHERAQLHVVAWQEQEKIAQAEKAAAEAKAAKARAEMVRVRVTLIPWGTLYVNRKAYSDKPRQEVRLAPGRYTFSLRQGDQEKVRKTVDVGAGSNTMVELVAK